MVRLNHTGRAAGQICRDGRGIRVGLPATAAVVAVVAASGFVRVAGIAAAPRGGVGAFQTPQETSLVAVERQLEFRSAFWFNLHHTLYAAAWDRRPERGSLRALAGPLPSSLDAPLTASERTAWQGAVEYYDREVASRDLLFGRGMTELKLALSAGDLSRPAIPPALRDVLQAAAPVYQAHFWAAHDRANRSWIADAADRFRTTAPDVVPVLEKLYGVQWFTAPVPIDVVWVGNRQGAYTTVQPPHVTISSGASANRGWTSAELVFHEVSHEFVLPLQDAVRRALGDRAREHGQLWHAVQFYLTGTAVQRALKTRGVEYQPYLYSTGLFDRAWPKYRVPVERSWQPYVDGTISMDEAIARTLAALGAGG